MSRPRAWLAIAAALLLAAPALSQEGQTGRLDVIAFGADGRPCAGLTVSVAEVTTATTGADGAARLVLSAGQHPVALRQGARVVSSLTLPVVWGEVTEVIVRFRPWGDAVVDVEAPAWPEARTGPPQAAEGALGALGGRVVDARTRTPVAGARVLVRGQMGEVTTDAQGAFELPLPEGTHAVSVIHLRFATATLAEVVVRGGERTAVDVTLTPSAVELEVVRVTGYQLAGGLAALLSERREERAMVEVLGAEQIGKSGDGDAAEALQRVTGLTVVGGRYVYVRGMGERYSSALLDGATLPSPDPERRVVPLDLFPADVIESLSVQKTYSPDLPGEFGGGVTKIRTKGIPDGFGASFSLSTAHNSESTFEGGLRYHGGATDWLGFDDGTRAIPPPVRIAADREPLVLEDPLTGEGYPLEVLTAFGQAMPNHWSVKRKEDLPPDTGFSGTIGSRHDTGLGVFGFQVGAAYDHAYRKRQGVERVLNLGAGGELTPFLDYRTESTTRSIDVSSLLSLGWQPVDGHELGVTTLWVRTTEEEAEVYGGYLGDVDRDVRVMSLDWVEEQLLTTQLRGRHELVREVALSWQYMLALATRDQPDWRRTRYDFEAATGRFQLSNRPEGNQRLYNEVEDQNHDASVALDVPFQVWKDLRANAQAGAGYVQRARESTTRRLKFIHRGDRSRDPDVLARPPEEVFDSTNLQPDGSGFSFEEITRATDNYEAEQTIRAAFFNLSLPITASLELSAGARLETSRQRVTTFELFSRQPTAQEADLETTDWLPAASLVWRFTDAMQLRAAYGRTLSRPDFRELSSAQFDQILGAGIFVGNPDLDRTRIDNFDLRWEWYLSEDESVSVGMFYKELRGPIETVILGGANRVLTLENARGGSNLGLELEVRKRLGMFGRALEPLFIAGNLSLIRSEVEQASGGNATNERRPLAGQSEYVVNASFGWDDPESRTSIMLLYNVSGERLVGVGTQGLPDIYEQPLHRLDAAVSWGFLEHWTIKLTAENLLDAPVRQTQDGETVAEYSEGRTFGLSLSGKF